MRDAASDLVHVDAPGALGRRIRAHLVERPAEVDGRRPGGREHLVGIVDVLALRRGQREPVRGRDADRRRPPHGQRPDCLRELRRIGAAELDHLLGQAPLVEDDDRVVLEPDDPLRFQVLRGYVPSSHEARYFACSSVSWSIEMPIVASFSRAISSSIAFGTT